MWVKIAVIIILSAVLTGCSLTKEEVTEQPDSVDTNIPGKNEEVVDDPRIYNLYEDDELAHWYVTILNENESHTFYEMNQWDDKQLINGEEKSLEAMFQSGDERGPIEEGIGYGKNMSNAVIQLRGNSSRREVQKSYKIKLKESAGLWNGQDVLNLNKHLGDPTRVTNKLSFDYFKLIPNLISFRTQFVHLKVKDLTANPPDNSFVSYGLYTHIEQGNKDFLATHGLNPHSHLYKVNNFEFHRYPDELMLNTDPNYNVETFEKRLEIKGDDNHSKLLAMLEDVNDLSININDVIDTHFNRENYLTWLAVNILFGNVDTMTGNFYLYSPLNSKKWFFIPWDYDKGWGWQFERTSKLPDWQIGISRYWGSSLHKRFLKDPQNVEALSAKIEELGTIINEQQTRKFLDTYYPIVKPFVHQPPDLTYYPKLIEEFDTRFYNLVQQQQIYKDKYYDFLEYPMPIFLDAKIEGNEIIFTWDQSFDFQGDTLTYKYQLSRDPLFKEILIEESGLTITTKTIELLPTGQYFWRVLVTDSKGNEQIPFDKYLTASGFEWGVKELTIK